MKFSLMFALCVLVTTEIYVVSAGNCNKSNECPFDLNSDLVTLENLTQEVEGILWMPLYYSDFIPQQDFGKCTIRWNAPDTDGVVRRQFMCYNSAKQVCEDYEVNVKRKVDDCGRAEENAVNATMDAKFFSQDISKYLWYDSCYEYNDANECTLRYLVLMIKRSRILRTKKKEVLDLSAFPWRLVSSDLATNFGLNFENVFVKFNRIVEPECGFDGKIIRKLKSSTFE